ncbi:MAG: hypothetical protein KAI81_04295 [Candidatus Marinimicrobia bacterium]|nr:hypothetical protein [Candidatus Neomarinimicrobiota bacterium]
MTTKQIINSWVDSKTWDVDDEYLTVTVQVDSYKFKRGDKVTVEISKD